jgi:threonine aldolase
MIFGSDNQAGASTQVMKAVSEAFASGGSAYGTDAHSSAAEDALRELFGVDLRAFFVVSGTAANTLALSTLAKPWEGTICHHQAHILLDESTGPALVTGGASLLPVPSRSLKLDPGNLAEMLDRIPNDPPHNVRPAAISISQASECGQVYTPTEVAAIGQLGRDRGLSLHMDGARFSNAVAHLGCHPAEITAAAGVDVLTLGATKNGALAAEAIVFFDTSLATDFEFQVKRTGHLVSKGRLFGSQFVAWLDRGHWLDLATHANSMATALRLTIDASSKMRLAFSTESNESFVIMKRDMLDHLIESGATMYDWYPDALPPGVETEPGEVLVRMVTSFATTASQLEEFEVAVAQPED